MSWVTSRRSAAAAVVLALGAGSLALLPSADATAKVSTNRYSGSDRYATAMAVAEHAFPSGAQIALLARGDNFPDGTEGFADALAGNYLAGAYTAPLLLTDGQTLPAATLQAFKDLKTKDVVILGGTDAVSSAVESELNSTPSTNSAGGDLVTERIAGSDRYQTAAEVAETIPSSSIGTINGVRTALIATGLNFPDALAGGPVADAKHLPLLLTDPNSLSSATANALGTLGIKAALILGGTGAISTAVEQQIQQLGISTERLAGTNRQQTAADIAAFAIQFLNFKDTLADLARGDDYPDSLAGGAEAGKLGPYPIVLTVTPNDLGADTAGWLQSVDGTLSEVDALGGTAAVSNGVLAEAAGDATCTPGPTTTTTTSPLGTVVGSSTLPTPSTTAPPPPCRAPVTTSTGAVPTSSTSTSSTTTTTLLP